MYCLGSSHGIRTAQPCKDSKKRALRGGPDGAGPRTLAVDLIVLEGWGAGTSHYLLRCTVDLSWCTWSAIMFRLRYVSIIYYNAMRLDRM